METTSEQYREALHAAACGVADLIRDVTDFTGPGLGEWDLHGLVGHFLRAIRTPISYLARPEPEGAPLPDAAHYVAGYLAKRDLDPDGMDRSVADRGATELNGEADHPADVIVELSTRLNRVLVVTPAERVVATPIGPMHLDDYLHTRAMEMVVHGLDIAAALERTWTPPVVLMSDVLTLLGDAAILRGSAADLIRAMTGREHPSDVLPILR